MKLGTHIICHLGKLNFVDLARVNSRTYHNKKGARMLLPARVLTHRHQPDP